jgi:hypothetical protein
VKIAAAIALLAATLAAPVGARDWTPHTAAALLDDTFETAEACQSALDDARRRESHAHPERKLNYTHLFEQGACRSFRHDGVLAWRIRMEWKAHATPHSLTP